MIFKLVWVPLLGVSIIFDIIAHGVRVDNSSNTDDNNDWIPIVDPRKKLLRDQNSSMLITYASNMFGPSVILKKEKALNLTRPLYLKGHALKTPDLSEIKFDPLSINHSMLTDGVTKEQRAKRGVLHLYNMVSCATGCNPLIYKGYGCYCGFLGSGYAVDGIDRCCKRHDWCYDRAGCPMFLEYIVPYFWKCYYNRPLCAIDHGEFGGPNSCAGRLCECDRVLSECLRRYPCPASRALCKSSPLRLLQNVLMFYP